MCLDIGIEVKLLDLLEIIVEQKRAEVRIPLLQI